MKIIDIEKWNRKEHFEFFTKMDLPYFGITTEIDCTLAYQAAKEEGISFFASYLHKSMIAVNTVPELRYRIVDNNVVEYSNINAGATIARSDGTFGFIYVKYSIDFKTFNDALQKEIKEVHQTKGLRLSNEELNKDLIRHSTIPWASFSALLHPTNLNNHESIPKITFGKFSTKDGRKFLPVSIEAHHGLADGLHLSRYLEEFQNQLNNSE